MKPILALLALCVLPLLAPAATADPFPLQGERAVGPCTLGYVLLQPHRERTTLACAAGGQELVYYASGSSWGGPYCELRVAGTTAYVCP